MKEQIREKMKKGKSGITLIALVVTIIVLLILAGISIGMLSGNNGILKKSRETRTKTERASVIEQAKTDVLGYQAENKGTDLKKSQLQSVLEKYFKSVPDLANMEDSEILRAKLDTLSKYGNHNIEVKEIFDGTFSETNQIPNMAENRWNFIVKDFFEGSGRFNDDGYFYFDEYGTDPKGTWTLSGKTLTANAWGYAITLLWDGEKFVGEFSPGGETSLAASLTKINGFKFKIDGVEYLADEGSTWRNWGITVDAKKSGYQFGTWNSHYVIKNGNDDFVLDSQSSCVDIDSEIEPGVNYICGTPTFIEHNT